MIVVDTNVVASLLLPGPKTELAEALRRRDRHWAAPLLWRSEFRNVLSGYLRWDLLQLPQALALLQQAEESLAIHDVVVSSEAVFCTWSTAATAASTTVSSSLQHNS